MKAELAGKRLLVLGAGHFQVPIIRRAKQLGCEVLTTDYLPDNPGHRLADRCFNVSTVDVEGVLGVARAEGIDGVVTYGSDVSAPTVTVVAAALGLPGNPPAAGKLLQRKDLIRDLQQRLGLPHPCFAAAGGGARLEEESRRQLRFPVIVKPADSSGSKGQSIVRQPAALPAAFDCAAAFSRCGVVVAEELLAEDLPELVGDVWIRDGALAFRQYGHNYFASSGEPRVPVGEIVPGLFGANVVAELDRQLQAIISALGLRCGCMNFDGMVSGGRVFLLDLGLRNGGNYLPDLIELSTGFDLTAAAIHSALGVPFAASGDVSEAAASRPAVSYVLGARSTGRLVGIEMEPELSRYLVREERFAAIGSSVEPFTRGDRCLGVLLFAFPEMTAAMAAAQAMSGGVRVIVA